MSHSFREIILLVLLSFIVCDNVDGYVEQMKEYNLTLAEMNKLLLCSVAFSTKLKMEEDKIDELKQKFNATNEQVYDKLSNEILEICFEKVDEKLVNEHFQNLTYKKVFEWKKEYEEFSNIDYSKYKERQDLALTMEQQVLAYKYHRLMDVFNQKRKDDMEKLREENRKVRIGKVEVDNIPGSIKIVLLLVVFGLLFGVCIWFISSFSKTQKIEKKKKKTK